MRLTARRIVQILRPRPRENLAGRIEKGGRLGWCVDRSLDIVGGRPGTGVNVTLGPLPDRLVTAGEHNTAATIDNTVGHTGKFDVIENDRAGKRRGSRARGAYESGGVGDDRIDDHICTGSLSGCESTNILD
jgi:hypothetical protein